eukprot:GEZU01030041.1.p4 GENE.GEZU01030041.1~~GEZU01030041.1.p4  ORF type:complete len:117 (+),score=10.17 GEZU01030041.1:632-982(+)
MHERGGGVEADLGTGELEVAQGADLALAVRFVVVVGQDAHLDAPVDRIDEGAPDGEALVALEEGGSAAGALRVVGRAAAPGLESRAANVDAAFGFLKKKTDVKKRPTDQPTTCHIK